MILRAILSVSIVIFMVFSTNAQIAIAPELGVGLSSMRFAPNLAYTQDTKSPLLAGRIGAIADYYAGNHFYLQAGIHISTKGNYRTFSYYRNDSFSENVRQTLNMFYVDAPFTVLFKTGKQGDIRFFTGLGITVSYLLGGINKLHVSGVYAGTGYDTASNTAIVSGNPVSGFDVGVNITSGIELPTGLYFKVYYTFGVNDIGLNTEIDKNRIYGIGAGYFLGKSRNINKDTDDLIDKSTN